MVPLPLSQGVLLSLLQQLACDISKDPARKLAWMTDVAVALNPTDPMIAVHVRPIFEQVYQILNHHRSLPTASSTELSSIRVLMHVINSMLMSGKWELIFLFLFQSFLFFHDCWRKMIMIWWTIEGLLVGFVQSSRDLDAKDTKCAELVFLDCIYLSKRLLLLFLVVL